MYRDVRAGLQRLTKFNRLRVVAYWLFLLLKQEYSELLYRFQCQTFLVKLAAIQVIVFPVMILLVPSNVRLYSALAPTWGGAYCISLIAAMVMRRKPDKRQHWLK